MPRKIVVKQGTHTVTFLVPRVRCEEWFKYFDGIISTAERKGTEIVQHVDATASGLDLVNSLLSGQGEDPAYAPLAHRLAVANVLTSAYVLEQPVNDIPLPPETVRLCAVWSAGDNDVMRRYKNLLHTFEVPTAEQYRRYRNDDSRAQVIGGSRKGMTIYRGAQRTLAAIYDELIVSVSGYAFNGVAIEGREEIARTMDTYHKVAAVLPLLSAAQVPEEFEDVE